MLWGYKKSGQKLGLPEMATLQGDQYAKLGRLICKQLHQSIGRTEIIDRYQLSALKLIDSWDDNLSPTSSAAAIYESLLMTITKRLVIPKLGPELAKEYLERWPQWSSFVEQVLEQKPIEWLPPEERTYETFILTSFSEALSNLRLALHNDDPKKWLWQDLHKARFRNMLYDKNASVFVSILSYLFNIGSLPVGGDQDCVNASNIVPSNNRFQFECDSGPTLRMLFDMSDQDKLYANLVLGQSGHLLSSHRTDQLKSWLHLEPHVLAFSSAQLDKQMQHKLLLNNH